MQEKILKKASRILVLGFAFFLVGLALFILPVVNRVFQGWSGGTMEKIEKIVYPAKSGEDAQETGVPTKNFPPPEKFRTFSYGMQEKIKISGRCSDEYYTVLIFPQGEDYRVNPMAARYNRAFKCPLLGTFSQDIDLRNLNLEKGGYYIIRAQQKKRGGWYNPY